MLGAAVRAEVVAPRARDNYALALPTQPLHAAAQAHR